MSQLGSGGGSSYPSSVDTTQSWNNGPNSGPDSATRVDAEMANDFGLTLVAIETELGADPAGSYATVRARLDAVDTTVGTVVGPFSAPFSKMSASLEITPTAGQVQYTVGAFVPANIVVFGVVAYVKTTLGNANGLTTWSLGTPDNPTKWGTAISRLITTATGPQYWLAWAGGENTTAALDVVVTTDAGQFDGTGVLVITYGGWTLVPAQSA